jgi:hypothetical protein
MESLGQVRRVGRPLGRNEAPLGDTARGPGDRAQPIRRRCVARFRVGTGPDHHRGQEGRSRIGGPFRCAEEGHHGEGLVARDGPRRHRLDDPLEAADRLLEF